MNGSRLLISVPGTDRALMIWIIVRTAGIMVKARILELCSVELRPEVDCGEFSFGRQGLVAEEQSRKETLK